MLNFKKMHGLGNDFVILDARENGLELSLEQKRLIADRRRGIGCDQLLVIERSKNWAETNFMRIYNPDGSEARACGNGTRCVAHLLMREDQVDNIIIETVAGSLNCWREAEQLVRVEMGKPNLKWDEIPLSKECDTLYLPFNDKPVAVNVGNPHCVFFVENIAGKWTDKLVEEHGKQVEIAPLFPERANVEFVEILARDHVRMRVWERGTGITQACGSGACAAAVAAIRRKLTDRKVTVTLDGGDLVIEWPSDDAPVSMIGPVTYVFDGQLASI